MLRSAIFSGLVLALCTASSELQAALVISFNPIVAPVLGGSFADFDIRVTNDAASVNVNAMKFEVQLTGDGATLAVLGTPSTDYRNINNNQYVFHPTNDNFGVATDSEFLVLSGGNKIAKFNDTARVPALVNLGQDNFRTIATNASFLIGKLRVNFAAPIAAPYTFQLAANALNGSGNEVGGGPTANYSGSYSGFGFGSGGVVSQTMTPLTFGPGTGFTFSITAVPEPSTMILVGLALSGAGAVNLRQRFRKNVK